MSSSSLVRHAPAPLSDTAFEAMKRQAAVLAKTELVPKTLQGKPESLMLIGLWGFEHDIPFVTAVQEVHVIENRPSPSAQLRLALIRRAGHEIRFAETSSERATLRARRREYRHDPDAWVTVTYTIDDARKAELLDQWVERWMTPPGADRKKKCTWKVGDDQGVHDPGPDAPEWVHEEIAAAQIHSKDNWRKYPADMLRARAAGVMSRMEFSDVLAALDIHEYTAEEIGVDVGQDLDEPADPDPSEEGDGPEEVIDDAVVVEDLDPEPDPNQPSAEPESGPVPGDTIPAAAAADTPLVPADQDGAARPREHPVPAPRPGERYEVTKIKWRRMSLPKPERDEFDQWLTACGIPDSIDISDAKIAALNAELDRRGAPKAAEPDDRPPKDG